MCWHFFESNQDFLFDLNADLTGTGGQRVCI